jgi:catechol 2,3-dioxygenase-like lactoylglutathione lyase family enzyme
MPGIRGRVFHVNVNCSDLTRALGFYRDRVGLRTVAHTQPTHPQPGEAFGLESAQWEAWILAGSSGLDGVALDVLEWLCPPPRHAAERGGWSVLRLGAASATALPVATQRDPDDTVVEIVDTDDARVAGVVLACSDPAASSAFCRDVLGLTSTDGRTFFDDRGPSVFSIELTRASAPPRPRAANDLGVYRVAFATVDLDRDYATLVAAGVRPFSPPTTLDMGPGLPNVRAIVFPDPDGTAFELIERPTPA